MGRAEVKNRGAKLRDGSNAVKSEQRLEALSATLFFNSEIIRLPRFRTLLSQHYRPVSATLTLFSDV